MDNVWTNLGNRLETAWKRPTRPNSKRPKDGEIIDEEKSVRWNREEVVRRQKAWDAECSRLKKAQNAEIEHISEAIELQIQEDIKAETKRSISKKAATILWQMSTLQIASWLAHSSPPKSQATIDGVPCAHNLMKWN